MNEYHQKLQVRGSFSIIRSKEYDRLDKGVLSRMEEQKTFRNRPQRASLGQNEVVACVV